jgi:hypothetical protein
MLAACTPQPEPAPKPTKTALFSSDAEAFKAAEETYAEYLTALNETDLSDARTFEPVYDWLTDTALASEKKSLSTYHAEKLHRTGLTDFDAFTPLSYADNVVIAHLCLDVSSVDLLSENNESLLQPDRATRRAMKVTFVEGDTTTHLVIASNHKPDGFSC